jgi:hypothetical protein
MRCIGEANPKLLPWNGKFKADQERRKANPNQTALHWDAKGGGAIAFAVQHMIEAAAEGVENE